MALRRTASSVGLTEMKLALGKGAGWLTHRGLYLLQGGLSSPFYRWTNVALPCSTNHEASLVHSLSSVGMQG